MTDNKDRDICKMLGICWNVYLAKGADKCMCDTCDRIHGNPDFSTDAGTVQLLRLMMEREDWSLFCEAHGAYEAPETDVGIEGYTLIDVFWIVTPGALRDAVWEFLCKEEKDD